MKYTTWDSLLSAALTIDFMRQLITILLYEYLTYIISTFISTLWKYKIYIEWVGDIFNIECDLYELSLINKYGPCCRFQEVAHRFISWISHSHNGNSFHTKYKTIHKKDVIYKLNIYFYVIKGYILYQRSIRYL